MTSQSTQTEGHVSAVIICGCGRSGTSYLRTLLDAHPEIFIPSESLFIIDYLMYSSWVSPRLWRWMLNHEPQLLCWYTGEIPGGTCFKDTITRIHENEAKVKGARIWGQKTPRFIRHMKLFERAFENLRWVLIYRDPRGVAASMKESNQHTSSVALASRRWINDTKTIINNIGHERNDRVLILKYEDLIENTSKSIEGVYEFLNVERVPVEQLIENGNPVFFSRSRFVRNTIRDGLSPISDKKTNWRKVLSKEEIEYIEIVCKREMELLGYETISMGFDKIPFALSMRAWIPAITDVTIVYRYLRYWPEYPIWTLFRRTLFRVLSLRKYLPL